MGQFAPAKVRDPWRIINGRTNFVVAAGAVQFEGKVLQVHSNGVRLKGKTNGALNLDEETEFFVANFPYPVAEDDYIGDTYDLYAIPDGIEKYDTVGGYSRSLHKLEYGKPCAAPPVKQPSAAEIAAQAAAAKAAAEKKQSDADKATFKFHHDRALAGDAGSQFRLGQLYLEGKGVNVDTNEAKAWFKKASNQGNEEAATELKRLDSGP